MADAGEAVRITLAQYAAGTTDLTRVTLLEQNLVPAEDTLAQAQGEIALGLIQVYRALGGGWQIRVTGCPPGAAPPAAPAPGALPPGNPCRPRAAADRSSSRHPRPPGEYKPQSTKSEDVVRSPS